VLDVGCGAGGFAAELAKRVEHVDALDRSPAMIEAARQTTPANVTCILGDVMRDPLPAERYDAIMSVAALHHLPVDDALRRLCRALRPGGILAAVALPRHDLARERPVEFLAAAGHRVFGATFAILRASGRDGWYRLQRPASTPQTSVYQGRAGTLRLAAGHTTDTPRGGDAACRVAGKPDRWPASREGSRRAGIFRLGRSRGNADADLAYGQRL
jgi:SAM-dependent methyltransferase